MTTAQRSRVMARNKGKNTSPERYVHDLAEAAGLSFSRHEASLPGKPDLVFAEARLAGFRRWRFLARMALSGLGASCPVLLA